MRMWMLPPECLCRKHLLGEHVEIHMAVKSNYAVTKALADKGFLDCWSYESRHDTLAREMLARGYKHDSPLDNSALWAYVDSMVDTERSKRDLSDRCPECRERIERWYQHDRKPVSV